MIHQASTTDSKNIVNVVPKENYNTFRDEAEKFNNLDHRKYHFTKAQITAIIEKHKAMGGGSVINPLIGRSGVFFSQVESLIRLGANKWHTFKTVRDMMESIMSLVLKKRKNEEGNIIEVNAWTDFYSKIGRDGALNPKDGDGKIIQNFRTLQRLPKNDEKRNGKEERNPYGLKLAQFLLCVDIDFRIVQEGVDPIPYFRLNTDWTKESDVNPIYNKIKKKS